MLTVSSWNSSSTDLSKGNFNTFLFILHFKKINLSYHWIYDFWDVDTANWIGVKSSMRKCSCCFCSAKSNHWNDVLAKQKSPFIRRSWIKYPSQEWWTARRFSGPNIYWGYFCLDRLCYVDVETPILNFLLYRILKSVSPSSLPTNSSWCCDKYKYIEIK